MVWQTASKARRLLVASSVAVLSALGLVVASPSAIASTSAGTVTATVAAEANWILSAQLPDGAIAVWPDRPVLRLIWPYLANSAAAGLARATEVTGDPTYVEHAWAYLRWYSSVEEPETDYVTDYDIVNGTTPVSDGHYDSTDAYAGTFLSAAWDAYYVSRDQNALESIKDGIAGAVHAIATTQQSDGLTWATPSYEVAYLMDNSQAYGGLIAAGRLAAALGDTSLAADAIARAQLMQQGINALWDPQTGAYDWAKQANGWQHPTQWTNLYPDAMQQVSAVLWGLVPAARAQELMDTFAKLHGDWSSPTATDNFLSGATVLRQPVGYWPMAGLAFNEISAHGTAASGTASLLASAARLNYAWPFTTADAGQVILAFAGGSALLPAITGFNGPHHNAPRPATGSNGGRPGETIIVRTLDDAPFHLVSAAARPTNATVSHTTLVAAVPRDSMYVTAT